MNYGRAMTRVLEDGWKMRRASWPESWREVWFDPAKMRVRVRIDFVRHRPVDNYYPAQVDQIASDWVRVRDDDDVAVVLAA